MTNIHALAPKSACPEWAEDIRRGLVAGTAVLAIVISPAVGSGRLANSLPTVMPIPALASGLHTSAHFADFGTETVAPDVRHLANWIADSRDNSGIAFVIVDKKYASVHVFDGEARLIASTPVLLGAARGDDSVPGIGSRPIAEVLAEERTTPAGRFIAERGHNTRGEDVVWVDYDAAVSMHRVLTTNREERRLERLATPTADDNHISYGCINVPVVFYETHIRPIFARHRAIVYVLPEVKSVQQVFGSYDVAAVHGIMSGPSTGIARAD